MPGRPFMSAIFCGWKALIGVAIGHPAVLLDRRHHVLRRWVGIPLDIKRCSSGRLQARSMCGEKTSSGP